jgi:hypothetical protein
MENTSIETFCEGWSFSDHLRISVSIIIPGNAHKNQFSELCCHDDSFNIFQDDIFLVCLQCMTKIVIVTKKCYQHYSYGLA